MLAATLKDIKEKPEPYAILLGLVVYQYVGYYTLTFVPNEIAALSIWLFLFILFCVLLIFVLEPPLSYVLLYHVACMVSMSVLIGGGIQYGPLSILIVCELSGIKLLQWAFESMKDDELLPLAIKQGVQKSKFKANILIELAKLIAYSVLIDWSSISPRRFRPFAAPWGDSVEIFPIFCQTIFVTIFNFDLSIKGTCIQIMV